MATETEIEAVAEAIWTTGGDTLWEHASTGAVIAYRRRARAAIEALDRVRADDARDIEGEEVCHRCGGPNRPWAAPSPLWNAVMRGGSINGHDEFDGIVCPTCFVVLAEERGIACGWWVEADTVIAELETVTPSGRTWHPNARRWVDAVSSTEPDTAKLVDALALLRGYVPMGGEGWNIINEALAGLSVDAVNSKAKAGGTT